MLNADKFRYFEGYYEIRFDEILSFIINAYKLLLKNNQFVKNLENHIRDILVEKYLNCFYVRELLGIQNVIFNMEPSENSGFVDIKVQTFFSLNNPKAYYIFECKRLDGQKKLNREYVENGIIRFTKEKYSTYYGVNGMIGFEVKKINTATNVENINLIAIDEFNDCGVVSGLTETEMDCDFQYGYISTHITSSSKTIKLYHLMLDFSTLIKE